MQDKFVSKRGERVEMRNKGEKTKLGRGRQTGKREGAERKFDIHEAF